MQLGSSGLRSCCAYSLPALDSEKPILASLFSHICSGRLASACVAYFISSSNTVVPAEAGTQSDPLHDDTIGWIPAVAGMTDYEGLLPFLSSNIASP